MINNTISKSPPSNLLGLFTDEGDVNIEATRIFLKMSKVELSTAFGLSPDQVRIDRMCEVTKRRIKDFSLALEFVAETFDGDKTKTQFWLNTANLNFGGSSPQNLILRGRYNKVLNFILAAKEGY